MCLQLISNYYKYGIASKIYIKWGLMKLNQVNLRGRGVHGQTSSCPCACAVQASCAVAAADVEAGKSNVVPNFSFSLSLFLFNCHFFLYISTSLSTLCLISLTGVFLFPFIYLHSLLVVGGQLAWRVRPRVGSKDPQTSPPIVAIKGESGGKRDSPFH